MIPLKFEIKYCDLCEHDMVICPICGNNCCNGTFGAVERNNFPTFETKPAIFLEQGQNSNDYMQCPFCELAYQYQSLYWGKKELEKDASNI